MGSVCLEQVLWTLGQLRTVTRASICPTGPDRRWAFVQPALSPPEEGPRATCGQPGLACPWGAAATLREGSREGRARAHAPLSPLFQFGRIADAPAHLQGSNQVVYNVSRPRLWRRGRCGCPPRGAGRTVRTSGPQPDCASWARGSTSQIGRSGATASASWGRCEAHTLWGAPPRPRGRGLPAQWPLETSRPGPGPCRRAA